MTDPLLLLAYHVVIGSLKTDINTVYDNSKVIYQKHNYFCTLVYLQGVLNGKLSKWFPQKPSYKVPVYLDSEQQQDALFAYLKGILEKTPKILSFTN